MYSSGINSIFVVGHESGTKKVMTFKTCVHRATTLAASL